MAMVMATQEMNKLDGRNVLEEKLRDGVRESYTDRFKERRSKIEIMADILAVARNEAKKTEIVYKTNLNFGRVGRYLNLLERRYLISNSGAIYRTTRKGEEFLIDYQRMKDILSSER